MWWSWRYFVAVSLMGLIFIVIGLAVALFPQSIISNIIIFLGIILIILSATYAIIAIWNDSTQKHFKNNKTSKRIRKYRKKIAKTGFSPKLSEEKVGVPDTEDGLLVPKLSEKKVRVPDTEYNSENVEESIREIEEKLKKKLKPEK